MARSRGILVLTMGLLLGLGAFPARADSTGWVLTLDWTPELCASNPGSRELQCSEVYYLIPGVLRPNWLGDGPDKCRDVENLEQADFDQLLFILPSRRSLKRIWRRYGACTEFTKEEYFVQLDRLNRRVIPPPQFREVLNKVVTTRDYIRSQFAEYNEGLEKSSILLECKSKWLDSVSFCLDSDFNYVDCGLVAEEDCKEEVWIRGNKIAHRFQ